MASFIKGDAVENATSYELLEKTAEGVYNSLAEKNVIDFEVSALALAEGDHILVVKAKADGYQDSDYSNEQIYTVAADAYVSYKGAEAFKNTGIRVIADAASALGWKQTTSGSTSAATDLLEVNSNNKIWISHFAVVNDQLGSGGFYDADQKLVAPLYWDTFGHEVDSSKKFVTPEKPVSIADIEAEWNCVIKYVRFIAWSSSEGGLENTEARIITPA